MYHHLQEAMQVWQQDERQVKGKQGHRELCAVVPCQQYHAQGGESKGSTVTAATGGGCYELPPCRNGHF